MCSRCHCVSELLSRMSLFRDRVALLTVLILLIIVSAPYALAVAWSPQGKIFLGSFYNSQDVSIYLSAMRAGARGEWLRTLPFTNEPHPPALYYAFYILLGHLAPPNLLTFHIARLLAAIVLAFALWQLISIILTNQLERRVAFMLALLGMGWGWLFTLGGLGALIRPTDIFAPTSSLLGSAIVNPHFPFGVALQFVILALYLRALREPYRAGTLLVGALACLLMSWVLPYQLVVVGAILGADVLWAMLRTRRVRIPEARHAFFMLLPGSTAIVYYESLTYFMPFWSELIQQWPVLEHIFAPLDFIVGYGWLLVLAIVGTMFLARQRAQSDGEHLLLAWFVVNALLIIAPLDFADRMSLGFSAALGMLSAITLTRALPAWYRVQGLRRRMSARYPNLQATFPIILLLIVMPSLLLLVFVLPLRALAEPDLPFYMSADDAQVMDWLALHARTSDVVLAAPSISNVIPAMSNARVYAGHTHETYQPMRKLAEVKQFFGADMSNAARRQFVHTQFISYVLVQPSAFDAGAFDRASYLEPVLRAHQVVLYRVVDDEY